MFLLLLSTLILLLFNWLLNFMIYLWLLIILLLSSLAFLLLFMFFLLVFLLLLLFCLLLCAFLFFLYRLRWGLFLFLLLFNLFYLLGFFVVDIFWRYLGMVQFVAILIDLTGLEMVDSFEQWLNKLVFALKLVLLLLKLAHLPIEVLYFKIILFNQSTLFPQLIFASRYFMLQLLNFYDWVVFLLLQRSYQASVLLDRVLESMDFFLQAGCLLT